MRRILVAFLCVLGTAMLAAPAALADVPPRTTWTEMYFKSFDDVELHADVLRPANLPKDAKTPVILSIGPYFGQGSALGDGPTGAVPVNRFPELFTEGKFQDKGYTVVNVDLRGFGGSTGCNDFGGKGERGDVKAAVEWAASQPWSNGKVALYGKSYDGWTGVMGLSEKPKGLAAAIIQSPIIDGYRTLYMNQNHYASPPTTWYSTPVLYQIYDLDLGSNSSTQKYRMNGAQSTNPACYAQNIALQNGLQDPNDAAGFWKDRNIVPTARGSSVPVFWSHGFLDANTKPDNFYDVWSTLTGPHRAWFGQYTHVRGNESALTGRKGFMDEVVRWLQRYINDVPESVAKTAQDPPVEVAQGPDGLWRFEAQWPPADNTRFSFAFKPGSYPDRPENPNATPDTIGTWTFTQALPYDLRLAGVPKVTVDVSAPAPGFNILVQLYDVDEKNSARLITRGIQGKAATGKYSFDLYPQDWKLKAGHRLGVRISGSGEDVWFTPGATQQMVDVKSGSVSLPFLSYIRETYVEGKPGDGLVAQKPFAVPATLVTDRTQLSPLPPPLTEAPKPAQAAGNADNPVPLGTKPNPNSPGNNGAPPRSTKGVKYVALKLNFARFGGSAKKRTKQKILQIRLRSKGRINRLEATLRAKTLNGKVFGKGTLKTINGKAVLRLKVTRKLKPGKYTLVVIGRDKFGRLGRATAKIRFS
jgi:hypothetical protein